MNGFEFQRPPRPGDKINIGDTLYRWAGTKRGAKVGSDRGIITFMSVGQNGGTGSLNAQFYLPGGSVVVRGSSTSLAGGQRSSHSPSSAVPASTTTLVATSTSAISETATRTKQTWSSTCSPS